MAFSEYINFNYKKQAFITNIIFASQKYVLTWSRALVDKIAVESFFKNSYRKNSDGNEILQELQ